MGIGAVVVVVVVVVGVVVFGGAVVGRGVAGRYRVVWWRGGLGVGVAVGGGDVVVIVVIVGAVGCRAVGVVGWLNAGGTRTRGNVRVQMRHGSGASLFLRLEVQQLRKERLKKTKKKNKITQNSTKNSTLLADEKNTQSKKAMRRHAARDLSTCWFARKILKQKQTKQSNLEPVTTALTNNIDDVVVHRDFGKIGEKQRLFVSADKFRGSLTHNI